MTCYLAKYARLTPNNPFLYFNDNHYYSYKDFHEKCLQLCTSLSKKNFQPGSRIVVYTSDVFTVMLYILACWKLRLIAVPVNPSFPELYVNEIAKSITASTLYKALPDLKHSQININLTTLSSHQELCFILTSGSTGSPKIASLNTSALFSSAQFCAKNLLMDTQSCALLSLPLYHVSGLSILCRSLYVGGSLYLAHKSNNLPDKITHISAVRSQVYDIIKSQKLAPKSLKAFLVGGSYIPLDLLNKLISLKYTVFMSYGCTEYASQIAYSCFNKHKKIHFQLLPQLATYTSSTNELFIKGPSLFSGYWDKKHQCLVQYCDENYFFNTRDDAEIIESGRLVLKEKTNNRVISGGENIDLLQIKNRLESFEDVSSVQVSFIDHIKWGKRPIASFSYTGNQSEVFFKNALKQYLPSFMVPDKLIIKYL